MGALNVTQYSREVAAVFSDGFTYLAGVKRLLVRLLAGLSSINKF